MRKNSENCTLMKSVPEANMLIMKRKSKDLNTTQIDIYRHHLSKYCRSVSKFQSILANNLIGWWYQFLCTGLDTFFVDFIIPTSWHRVFQEYLISGFFLSYLPSGQKDKQNSLDERGWIIKKILFFSKVDILSLRTSSSSMMSFPLDPLSTKQQSS